MSTVDSRERLRDLICELDTEPYLVSVTGEGRPHCSLVDVGWGEEGLLVAAPRHWEAADGTAGRHVTVLWPPAVPGGYSLIVDGLARTTTDGTGLTIVPARAVWHRRGAGSSPTGLSPVVSSCQSDCLPIL